MATIYKKEKGLVGTKEVDETDINNNKILVYRSSTGKICYENKPSGGSSGTSSLQFYLAGNLYVADNIAYLRVPSNATISKVRIGAITAPVGASIIVDINKSTDGSTFTTIFTNQANRPTIADSAHTGETTTIDVSSVSSGDWLVVCVDQVGSTTTGTDLNVEIIF